MLTGIAGVTKTAAKTRGRKTGVQGPGVLPKIWGALDRKVVYLAFLLALTSSAIGIAEAQVPSQADLGRMDVEDLMNVKVTSVSKREQSLSRTAAGVFVINQEDIRRSGATNIPDLLRMAPGVDVEQIDANVWAISIRGFNWRYSNKVLVLVDGRTVYTPSFSGVFWETLDLPLNDIDRIEVARGAGATIWGANAVNGVINIFTKSSKNTKGAQVTAAAGSQLKALGVIQYGGTAGTDVSYRLFGKSFEIGNSAAADGSPAADHWMRANGGFRMDADLSSRDALMVQGSLFLNEAHQSRTPNFIPAPSELPFHQSVDAAGGDVLARWAHSFAGGSDMSIQAYYDTYRRNDFGTPEVLRTLDLSTQDHMVVGDRHDVVWGLGYRVSTSAVPPGYAIALSPPSRTDSLYSGFLQDEIRASNSLWVTIGGRVDHNPYTGFQIEPSIRLAWTPASNRQTLWVSASKALRQPSRIDTSAITDAQVIPLGPDAVSVIRLYGNLKIKDEEVRDYEAGYRTNLSRKFSIDADTFFSFYRHLQTVTLQPLNIIAGSPTQFEIPLIYENRAQAVTYGGELSLSWQATPRWRISPGYSYLHATLRVDPSAGQLSAGNLANGFPQNMLQIRSSLNLPRKFEFDQSLYYTARLPGGVIAGHARLDLRLARHFWESAEISVVGQDLLRPRSMEYGDAAYLIGTQSVRRIYAQIAWKF